MKIGGGIISLLAGLISVVMGFITLAFGGFGRGTFVAIFMVLSLIGAFINYLGVNGELKTRELEESTI